MLASFFSSFIQLYSMIICITDIQRTAHINVHNFMSLLYSGFHDNIKGTGIATVSQSFLMFLCFCFICFLLSLFFFFSFLVFRFVLEVTTYADDPIYMLCKISAEHQEPADTQTMKIFMRCVNKAVS